MKILFSLYLRLWYIEFNFRFHVFTTAHWIYESVVFSSIPSSGQLDMEIFAFVLRYRWSRYFFIISCSVWPNNPHQSKCIFQYKFIKNVARIFITHSKCLNGTFWMCVVEDYNFNRFSIRKWNFHSLFTFMFTLCNTIFPQSATLYTWICSPIENSHIIISDFSSNFYEHWFLPSA